MTSRLHPPRRCLSRGTYSDVLRLSFDPRSEFLVCADKSEIIVWSTKTRTKVASIPLPPSYPIKELAVIPGGRLAVSPGSRYVAATSSSGGARLWDTHSNDHIGTIIPVDDARSVSFSPDGTRLSIGGQNEVRLWILGANRFDPRRIPVGGVLVKFSPDGSRLATQETESGQISVWKLDMRDPLLEGTVNLVSPRSDFALTFDNSRLVVSAVMSSSGVFVEPFDASWALGHVCRIVRRNLTSAERTKYLPPGFDYTPTCRL